MTPTTLATRVADIMSGHPITVDRATSARELARVLIENEISGVPVTDARGKVIGVVSKTDLLQWCVRGGLGFGAPNLLAGLAEGRLGTSLAAEDLGIVEDFMTDEVVTATPDEPLSVVAQRMADEKVHRVIVLNKTQSIVGVLTSFDMLRAFAVKAILLHQADYCV